ncbi:hypothetical protein [Modestobacter italicus]|uniref:hypothetical protein n=1 Tax=Modestobacter italicus (strain DSM 44449 / CECT 9708 / BC 501) TaxID=2732864 RepID=UPI00141271D6|nr:hypothetical protein [Modestobacter marinus]
MTAQPLFDGTFSIDAVASTAHAVVARLHDEAMATIAALAETWDQPVEEAPAVEADEPVTYREPATWSVADEEDEPAAEDDEDDVLPVLELPPLLLRPRPAGTNVTARLGAGERAAADAATDEFAAAPSGGRRQFVAI